MNPLKVLLVLFLVNSFVFASDYLRIQDPQSTWRYGYGTIEEAVISVKPKGLYMECGLYLTISAKGLGFTNSDTMEIQYYFTLPEEAIVHDSWLWVNDEIIRGKLLDKWTASSIYEDIVKRRRDPSILFKRSKTQYEMRIFPMAGNESRKIKITFLLPANWTTKTVNCALPVNMLNVYSYNPIQTFHVLSWIGEEWNNPRIIEFPENEFEEVENEEFGNFLRTAIPVEAVESGLHYAIDAPFTDGVYLNKFQSDEEDYYQLALLPSALTDFESSSKKVAFLFDHVSTFSSITSSEILNNVKEILQTTFSERDSFNLIFTKLSIERTSDSWISADSLSIENVFSNLEEGVISNYSSLPSLLSNGINFIQENGNTGNLLLLSSSNQVGESAIANELIEDLISIMEPVLPIHIADYATWSAGYHWIGGRAYYGNEYFYTNISRLTSANYLASERSGRNLPDILQELSHSLDGFIKSFDLHTTLENGYCYGRFDFQTNQTIYLNKPLLQIGKYNGSFPFNIEIAGEFNGFPFSTELAIDSEVTIRADSLNEEMWTGKYILSQERISQTNDVINDILAHSFEERVLSLYTAFLCLEPSRGGEVCYDCMDESDLISSVSEDNSVENDSLIHVYPNPFNNQTKIQLSIKKAEDLKSMSYKIFNINGQVVKTFKGEVNEPGKLTFTWFGENNNGSFAASGTYFFVAAGGSTKIVKKLLLLK